jgi:hypothetical protein
MIDDANLGGSFSGGIQLKFLSGIQTFSLLWWELFCDHSDTNKK